MTMSANSARQLSAAFYEASNRCLTERPCGNETLSIILVPGIVCAALSIELGFKAMIMNEGEYLEGTICQNCFMSLGHGNKMQSSKTSAVVERHSIMNLLKCLKRLCSGGMSMNMMKSRSI